MPSVKLMIMRNIGNRLKYFRERLGLSQLELSQKSNISQASIARIEANQQKNLKTETIEKLASAFEIPLSQLLEESLMIREETPPYEATKMLPVIKLEEFIRTRGRLNIKAKADVFEPSLTRDPEAFFLLSTEVFIGIPSINKGDLLLIEPNARIQDSDIILFLSKNKTSIGKIYCRSSVCILQPLNQDSEPIFFANKKRQKDDIRLFRVSEIRKKY